MMLHTAAVTDCRGRVVGDGRSRGRQSEKEIKVVMVEVVFGCDGGGRVSGEGWGRR